MGLRPSRQRPEAGSATSRIERQSEMLAAEENSSAVVRWLRTSRKSRSLPATAHRIFRKTYSPNYLLLVSSWLPLRIELSRMDRLQSKADDNNSTAAGGVRAGWRTWGRAR